ncbi:D-Ala-D-Ala carboxypeptidase family metallohydrolase [Cereibacter sphaeroides f. sp. denitrificans]
MDKLQALRDRPGKPLIVRSAYRSPEHNRAVGGAPASKHMQGTAFDIAMANHDPAAFEAAVRAAGFLGFAITPAPASYTSTLGLLDAGAIPCRPGSCPLRRKCRPARGAG